MLSWTLLQRYADLRSSLVTSLLFFNWAPHLTRLTELNLILHGLEAVETVRALDTHQYTNACCQQRQELFSPPSLAPQWLPMHLLGWCKMGSSSLSEEHEEQSEMREAVEPGIAKA